MSELNISQFPTANSIDGTNDLLLLWQNATLTTLSISRNTLLGITAQPVGTTSSQTLTNKDLTSGTNTFPTFNQNTTGSAAKLTTARTIGGVSFDGTANITVATATGGFTISGGDLSLGSNNIVTTGSLGSTGFRLTKGWFVDLEVTNTITGSITGNAATVTTNANLTGVITSSGNATSIASQTGTGTKFVVDTSPTIVTPTIASFANANHNHTNSAGGGTLTSAAVNSTVAQVVAGGNYKVQSGVAVGSNSADVTVTFSSAFTGTPSISGEFVVTSAGSGFISLTATSNTAFSFATLQNNTTRVAGNYSWIAIGN